MTVAALERPTGVSDDAIELLRITLPHPLQRIDRTLHGRAVPAAVAGTGAVRHADTPRAPRRATAPVRLLRKAALPLGEVINSRLFDRAVHQRLAGRRFDIVQAHDAPALAAAAHLATAARAVLVYDGVEFVDERIPKYSNTAIRFMRRLESGLEARLIRRARLCFTIGDGMADWMCERYGIARPLVVRNCRWFEPPVAAPRRIADTLGLPTVAKVVLYLNSVTPGRGFEQTLHALALLDRDVHLAVLGESQNHEYQQSVTALADSLGVSSRVHFMPLVDASDVVAFAAGAELGVIPYQRTVLNTYHAMPNRLFEMVMARLPIAASAFPGLRSVVEGHGIGVTFEPEDPVAIADALRQMLDREAIADFRERAEAAATELSWENESRSYIDALHRIAVDSGGTP